MGQGGEVEDVEGFALLERTAVRRAVRDFDWRRFDEPSPRNRLALPLSDATVALVSTSGARLAGQPRFDTASILGDPTYREIPSDTAADRIRFNHAGYDVRNAYADPDCVFPLDLLGRYAAEGRIGRVAPRTHSLMGYITQTDVLLEETGPAIARALAADDVDLAFLVPA